MTLNLDVSINEKNKLELPLPPVADREELKEALEDKGSWVAFSDLLESWFTNGELYPFNAGDGNPLVGLTEAPCIAKEMTVLDDGDNPKTQGGKLMEGWHKYNDFNF